jgi:hypothetical protein
MNHPTNNNKGNLAYAEQTFDNLLKGFTQTERAQFMIYGAIKNFLSDGVFSPEEQAKYGDQLAYWADNFGIKYNVKEDGTVNVIDKNGKEHNGKEYFEKAFNEHAITKSFNQTIERIKKQNSNADEQARNKQEMYKLYTEADSVNNLTFAKDEKERQKVRDAWAESKMFLERMNELYPDSVDENILKAQKYFQNYAGENYISPFDADVDEINMERSQHNLSSLDDKVIKQTGVASRTKAPTDLQRAAFMDRGRKLPTDHDEENKALERLVNERNKAQEKYNKHKSRYEQSSKRHGKLERYRKSNNKKDK